MKVRSGFVGGPADGTVIIARPRLHSTLLLSVWLIVPVCPQHLWGRCVTESLFVQPKFLSIQRLVRVSLCINACSGRKHQCLLKVCLEAEPVYFFILMWVPLLNQEPIKEQKEEEEARALGFTASINGDVNRTKLD